MSRCRITSSWVGGRYVSMQAATHVSPVWRRSVAEPRAETTGRRAYTRRLHDREGWKMDCDVRRRDAGHACRRSMRSLQARTVRVTAAARGWMTSSRERTIPHEEADGRISSRLSNRAERLALPNVDLDAIGRVGDAPLQHAGPHTNGCTAVHHYQCGISRGYTLIVWRSSAMRMPASAMLAGASPAPMWVRMNCVGGAICCVQGEDVRGGEVDGAAGLRPAGALGDEDVCALGERDERVAQRGVAGVGERLAVDLHAVGERLEVGDVLDLEGGVVEAAGVRGPARPSPRRR